MRYQHDDLDAAEAWLSAGEINEALDALNGFLRLDSRRGNWIGDPIRRNIGLRLRAGILARHSDENSLRAALDDLDTLDGPLSPDDHLLRSVIYERLGRIDEALASVQRGCARHQRHARLAERHINLLRGAGHLDEARQVAAAWISASPVDWRWQRWAAELAAESGDDNAALLHYEAAREQLATFAGDSADPTYTPMIAALMLAQAAALARLDRLAEADVLYIQAAELMPDDPLIAFNRGLLAARRGDLDTATALCEQGLRAGSPDLQAHMRQSLDDSQYDRLRQRLG